MCYIKLKQKEDFEPKINQISVPISVPTIEEIDKRIRVYFEFLQSKKLEYLEKLNTELLQANTFLKSNFKNYPLKNQKEKK